jgi:hypothetical protein
MGTQQDGQNATAGPILVAGADRSGTSLMYALLASHSAISMVRRTNLWRWFHSGYGDLRVAANLERCLDALERYPRVERLGLDRDRLRRELYEGPPTYGRLFSLIHEHHAERVGKPRWGDKSLHMEHHLRTVLEELPDARLIQMVRDPRDRYASILKRYDDRTKGVSAVMGRWLGSVAAMTRNERQFPARVLTVRYETLARDPETTMQTVCSFIGEPYEAEMLSMRGAPDHGAIGGNSSFARLEPGVISTRSIGRFRDVLAADDIAAIQALAGRRLQQFGYEPLDVDWPSTSARYSFALTVQPVRAVKLAGWWLKHRFDYPGERPRPSQRQRLLDRNVQEPTSR